MEIRFKHKFTQKSFGESWYSKNSEMNFLNDTAKSVLAWFKSKALILCGPCSEELQLGQGNDLTLISSTITSDSELFVDGALMRQQLEISEFQSQDGKIRIIHVYHRSINDQFIASYKVVNSSSEESIRIATPMSNDEIEEFESEWANKWNGGHL